MVDNIIAQLKNIIVEELDVNCELEDIDEKASLFEEGLGLDSVTIMEFIALIERSFSFQFSDEELNMEPFKNLQTLADFISTKLGTQSV
ncbi:phosphopantetheine-binding protein [Candidatus Halobeggiatoa sp. HSG11]|nr:phosphopantetheine-binding protein [Candidatus Halobeggiatoa sp. HSG11]